ncbi:MAG: hypothetical protein EPO11_00490, partial [Gammaproteobacteria bacterium]
MIIEDDVNKAVAICKEHKELLHESVLGKLQEIIVKDEDFKKVSFGLDYVFAGMFEQGCGPAEAYQPHYQKKMNERIRPFQEAIISLAR